MMTSDARSAGQNARAELSKSFQDHGTAQQPVAADGAHASPLNRGMGVARGESRSEADTVICTECNQRKEAARDKRL